MFEEKGLLILILVPLPPDSLFLAQTLVPVDAFPTEMNNIFSSCLTFVQYLRIHIHRTVKTYSFNHHGLGGIWGKYCFRQAKKEVVSKTIVAVTKGRLTDPWLRLITPARVRSLGNLIPILSRRDCRIFDHLASKLRPPPFLTAHQATQMLGGVLWLTCCSSETCQPTPWLTHSLTHSFLQDSKDLVESLFPFSGGERQIISACGNKFRTFPLSCFRPLLSHWFPLHLTFNWIVLGTLNTWQKDGLFLEAVISPSFLNCQNKWHSNKVTYLNMSISKLTKIKNWTSKPFGPLFTKVIWHLLKDEPQRVMKMVAFLKRDHTIYPKDPPSKFIWEHGVVARWNCSSIYTHI